MEQNYLIGDIEIKRIFLSTLFLLLTLTDHYYKLKKMTHITQRKVVLWFNIILAATNGDLVAAYELLLQEACTRSLFFVCNYGAAR